MITYQHNAGITFGDFVCGIEWYPYREVYISKEDFMAHNNYMFPTQPMELKDVRDVYEFDSISSFSKDKRRYRGKFVTTLD